MRNTIIRTVTVVVVGGGMLIAASRVAEANTTLQEWRFTVGTSPATPEVCDPLPGSGPATITPGEFSSGWQDQLPGLGTATGFWDLGRSGRITVPVSSTPASEATTIRVKVCQWLDGGIFSAVATVSVPGATRVSSTTGAPAATDVLGGWVVNETVWNLESGQTTGPVTVTSGNNGSLVDLVSVAAGPAGGAVALSIRPANAAGTLVELSWPGDVTGYSLESTASLNEPIGWQPLAGQPALNAGRWTLNTASGGAQRFYRLRKP